MYEQTITPNYNIPYVGGLCEGFVEGSVGAATLPFLDKNGNWTTNGVYPSAIDAWNSNFNGGNHPNESPPNGIIVSLYFSLGNNAAGHVALSIGDGRVASSTQVGKHPTAYIHPSLKDLMTMYSQAQGSCTYLGWSEYIGKKQVVKKGEDMIPNGDIVQALFRAFRGRGASAAEINKFVNTPYTDLIVTLDDGQERKDAFNALMIGKQAVKDKWDQQIYTLEDQVKDLQAQVGKTPTPLEPGLYEIK